VRYSNRIKSTPDQLVRQVQRGTRAHGGLQNFGQRPMFSDPFDEESYKRPPSLGLGPEEQLPDEEPLDWSPGSDQERALYQYIQDNLARDKQHVQLGDGSLGGLSDVTLGGLSNNDLLAYNGSVWTAQNASEAGLAADNHTHNTSDITLGTLALARGGTNASLVGIDGELIQMASDGSALEGSGSTPADFAEASHTHVPGDIVGGFWDLDVGGTNADLSGGAVNSELIQMNAGGTALEGSGSTTADFAAASHTHTAGDITSVIGLDIGGTAADLSGGGLNSEFIRMNSGGTALEGSGSTAADFAAASHEHAAGDITSGQLALTRGGTAADLSDGGLNGELIQMNSGGTALEGSGVIVSTLAPLDSPTFTTAINLPDDVPIIFGTGDDWSLMFDSVDDRLELTNDSGNSLYVRVDNGDVSSADLNAVRVAVDAYTAGSGDLRGVYGTTGLFADGTQAGDVIGWYGSAGVGEYSTSLAVNGSVYGGFFRTYTGYDSTPTVTGDFIGVHGEAIGFELGGGTLANIIGGNFRVDAEENIVTDAIGVRIPAAEKDSGSITNAYGLKVAAQVAGTNNYSIYLDGAGGVHFDGAIPKIWSSDSTQLDMVADGYMFSSADGDEILELVDAVGSPINYLQISNAASGDSVLLEPKGETDVWLEVPLQGTGRLAATKTSTDDSLYISAYANGRSSTALYSYNNAYNVSPQIQGYKARGTQNSPSGVLQGHFLLTILGYGRDTGGNTQFPARIQFVVTTTGASGSIPTAIQFQTGNNLGDIDNAIVCDDDQDVSIPNGDLSVDGNVTAGGSYSSQGFKGIDGTYGSLTFKGGILIASSS